MLAVLVDNTCFPNKDHLNFSVTVSQLVAALPRHNKSRHHPWHAHVLYTGSCPFWRDQPILLLTSQAKVAKPSSVHRLNNFSQSVKFCYNLFGM